MDTLASLGDPLILAPDSNSPDPVDADPLIEVQSITIHPDDENKLYQICGLIYVLDRKEGIRNQLYSRGLDNPETITAGNSLSLTGPASGAISMVGAPSIVILLKVRPKDRKKKGRTVWFAQVRSNLDTSTQLCFEETKSLTLRGSLGVVRVNYIVLPCACIAGAEIALTKEGEQSLDYEGPDPPDIATIGSPDAHVSGSVIACYGKTSGHFGGDSHVKQHPSFILYKKSEDECGPVAYGVPIKLCRSFVCMPAYSSLSLTLNLTFKEFGGTEKIVVKESTEFKTCGGTYQQKYFCVGKFSVEVILQFFTSDDPLYLEKIHKRPKSPPSTFRSVPPEVSLWGRDRIEVLSVFVGHDSKKMDDLCGIIAVQFFKSSYYIFRRDEKHPDNLSRHGKALSLEGLTTERSDWFCLCLRLKDMSDLVDIHNYLHIYYYHYDLKRQWFNRPLCSVVFGKHGFAVVHYIIFENAAKATVKISVVAKVSDSLPIVYGALVAQYSNFEYPTSYQKNYWRSVLFEEPQEKDARHLTEDGEIPLSKNVVSVHMGSSLVIDVDLHASVRRSAGATSDGSDACNAEHFEDSVEFEIGGFGCKKLPGEYYDVVFSTEWTDGS